MIWGHSDSRCILLDSTTVVCTLVLVVVCHHRRSVLGARRTLISNPSSPAPLFKLFTKLFLSSASVLARGGGGYIPWVRHSDDDKLMLVRNRMYSVPQNICHTDSFEHMYKSNTHMYNRHWILILLHYSTGTWLDFVHVLRPLKVCYCYIVISHTKLLICWRDIFQGFQQRNL